MRKEIRTETVINATAEKIWKALIEFPQYREWNPFIIFVKGKTLPGSHLKMRAMFSNGSTMRTVTRQAMRCWRWSRGRSATLAEATMWPADGGARNSS